MNEHIDLTYKGNMKGDATPIYDVWILTTLFSGGSTLEDIGEEQEPFYKIKKAPDGA